jgi:hypothetical protein
MTKTAARRLTETICRGARVPAGKSQIILWDSVLTGLGLRCLPGGSRTWIFSYRPWTRPSWRPAREAAE